MAKKLAFIETCLRDLQHLARPEAVATDVTSRSLAGRRGIL
ncbi:MAG: hypothetical protein AB7T37_10755 [Dehalococcoidia bacterium]